MTDQPLPIEVPKTAGAPKITLGDLKATLTVEQALELIDQVVSATRDNIEANIEHWSDGDWMHWTPFRRDLDKELPKLTDSEALSYFINNRII